jgi:hypothetical protein
MPSTVRALKAKRRRRPDTTAPPPASGLYLEAFVGGPQAQDSSIGLPRARNVPHVDDQNYARLHLHGVVVRPLRVV